MTDGKSYKDVSDETKDTSEHSWEDSDYWDGRLKVILALPDSAQPSLLTAGAIEIECKGADVYKELVQRFTGDKNQPFSQDFQGDEFYLHIETDDHGVWNIEYIHDNTENAVSTPITDDFNSLLNAHDSDYRSHGGT